MPSAGVVEGVDIGFDFLFSVAAGFVNGAPDQLGFDGFKDGFDHGVVIAITFARHGYDEAVGFEELLIGVGAILATPIRMMNDPFAGGSDGNGAL